jgi:2-keto-4-pentenoate hydratase/2-oxohepta-3-ene-1,7-dioic acid hydratase in catechol pathway
MGPGRAVAGYAVADDVSARDLQGREPQWTRAKGADGFCPYGPWITTAEEIEDPHSLALRTWVNGELRQDSNTSNLIFTIPQLIEFISETCTLHTGDVILTGTPSAWPRTRRRSSPAATSCASRSRRSAQSSTRSPERFGRALAGERARGTEPTVVRRNRHPRPALRMSLPR